MPFRRLALAALVAVLTLATGPRADAADGIRPGDVPPQFAAPKLAGPGPTTISLAKLRGKPVYLDFFASWCGPCNDEAAGIESFYTRYHAKGLVTIGVDSDATTSDGVAFAKQHGWTFASVDDSGGTIVREYRGIGLPLHVFIDRSGKISTYHLGEMSPGEIDAALKKIVL